MNPNLLSSGHEVERQLSFALYSAAGRVARLHKPLLAPLGLTFPQYLVMLELFAGTPRTVGDLGGKLGMDTGTITPLLKRMEAAGMVTRARDPADERRVLIDLTEHAETLRHEVWNVAAQVAAACQLSQESLAQLRDSLNQLARYGPESAAE